MNMTVKCVREGSATKIDTGGPALGTITVDTANLPEDQKGGAAKQLLGASVLLCYCSTLASALEARAVKYNSINTAADMVVDNNEKGQSRVKKIKISATVSLSEDDEDVFARIQKIMRNGCLVTGSLHEGIEMEYRLEGDFVED